MEKFVEAVKKDPIVQNVRLKVHVEADAARAALDS
jgi:hypothetical protein